MYTCDPNGGIQEWDAPAGRLLRVVPAPGRARYIRIVAGRAVRSSPARADTWRSLALETKRPLSGPLADITGNIYELNLSPDGRSILTGMWDRHNTRLWDAATGKQIGPAVQHGEAVQLAAFTPDGKRMVSVSVNGEFRSQDVPSPISGNVEQFRCWVELLTGMELDADGVIRDLDAGTLQAATPTAAQIGRPSRRCEALISHIHIRCPCPKWLATLRRSVVSPDASVKRR